jgi:anti-anti-sigma factor
MRFSQFRLHFPAMSLTLQTRSVGSVVVIRCVGRIVVGNEAASLEAEVRRHFAERSNLVLNLEEMNFMDSSGLGLLVRLIGAARHEHLAFRLCGVTAPIQRILTLTNLSCIFNAHESEAEAIAAAPKFSQTTDSKPSKHIASVLCVHGSQNLLASIREALTQGGYEVHSTAAFPDAMLLLKACRPELVIASPRALPRLIERAHEMQVPIIEIDDEFAEADAGEAVSQLLDKVKAHFQRSATA